MSQEPGLFAGTVTDNILIGKEEASEDEVKGAAIQADAHNFITTLPQVRPSKMTPTPSYGRSLCFFAVSRKLMIELSVLNMIIFIVCKSLLQVPT